MSALKLHKALLKGGEESRLFVLRRFTKTTNVHLLPIRRHLLGPIVENIGFVPGSRNLLASGLSAADPCALNAVHNWADIILLRWIPSVISDLTIAKWSRMEKPLVWTLSDMSPFTGGCFYTGGCQGFTHECFPCPLTPPNLASIPRSTQLRRHRTWEPMNIVAPSRWIAESCRKSLIARRSAVHTIRTGVETDIFVASDPLSARRKLGVDPARVTIFTAAHSTADPRKGFDLLVAALRLLPKEFVNNALFLTAGHHTPDLQVPNSRHLGHITDRGKLAEALSAADVTALPYREDNLPNIALESISCGTPVVAFSVGGIPDVVVPKITGFLVPPFDIRAFADALQAQPLKTATQANLIRSWAQGNLSMSTQAASYISLFRSLLGATPATRMIA